MVDTGYVVRFVYKMHVGTTFVSVMTVIFSFLVLEGDTFTREVYVLFLG